MLMYFIGSMESTMHVTARTSTAHKQPALFVGYNVHICLEQQEMTHG